MKSWLGYFFGGALLVIAVAVAWVGVSSGVSTIKGMQRVAMPGDEDIVLPAGPSTLYIETHTKIGDQVIDSGEGDFRLRCDLESPPGWRKLELIKPKSHVSYSLGGYKGHNGFDVIVGTGGKYTLHCQSDGDRPFAIAVGTGVGAWIVVTVVAIIPALAGLALLIVTIIRRRRARRAAITAGGTASAR